MAEDLRTTDDEIVETIIAELSEIDDDGTVTKLVEIRQTWDEAAKAFTPESVTYFDRTFEALQAEAQLVAADPAAARAAAKASGLDVARFAWEIIKDSKPVTAAQGAFTAVLDSAETDPLRYPGARDFTSKLHHLRYANIFNMTLAEAKFKVMGTNKAQKPPASAVPNGNYIPQAFVSFTECFAAITWSLNGSAQITGAANVGAADDVNPQIFLTARITASSWLQSFSPEFTFKLRGRDGVVK